MILRATLGISLIISNLVALENGLARKPPMGWMSWASFYCETNCTAHPTACINQQLYMDMADKLVGDGYKDAGYTSIHVDDCWMTQERDKDGKLVADPERFKDGIKNLAKYMHDKGLKFAIYEDLGPSTCAGYPGSYQHEKVDAQTFADWDCDYLKYDGCNIDIGYFSTGYLLMAKALNDTGKPIIYSCEWPFYMMEFPQVIDYKLIGKYCHLFRNFYDVANNWKSIMSIIRFYDRWQDKQIPAHGPGHWFDPDMLVGGNNGVNVNMARSQMTIWSIWSAPLIISTDLRTLGDEFKKIFLNKDVIAIDQDPMGKMGRLMLNSSDCSDNSAGVYAKPIEPIIDDDTSFAIAVLNRNDTQTIDFAFTLDQLGLLSFRKYNVTELWSGSNLGIFNGNSQCEVHLEPADSYMLRAVIMEESVQLSPVKKIVLRRKS